uniref:protoporphyrinogen oxidase-like n=1 Tax=Styela clava TaxID=7725 RepID=UPI00193A21E2|nr:protoporphyrinogen oxidase-like [Styela clava]
MASRIVVLGGGVSGLSSAYYLARGLLRRNVKYDITLVEKNKLGGWMQTENFGEDGPVFELGPRSLRTAGFVGMHSLILASELGLEDDMIAVGANESANINRFLYVDKSLHKLPNSLKSMFNASPPLTKSLLMTFIKGMAFRSTPEDAETVYDILLSRFGEEVTKYHADAFVRGIFASDIKELSMKAAFPILWEKLKPKNSRIPRKPKLSELVINNQEILQYPITGKIRKEQWTQWSLDGGLANLINALEKNCQEKDVNIMKNTEAKELIMQENGKFTVKIESKETESQEKVEEIFTDIDQVISALPAHELSKVLRKSNGNGISEDQEILQNIGTQLKEIKSVDVGVVNLEFNNDPEDLLPDLGFGHLVPSCEESKVLGIVYDSCVFPRHDRKGARTTRLTCMMGGSWFNELFGDAEHVNVHDLEQAALESVAEQLGITADPRNIVSKLCRNCIPTYRVSHTDLVESMEDTLKENEIPLHLGGASYWGVSVNDCIYNSRYIADKIVDEC